MTSLSTTKKAFEANLIEPPKWLPQAVIYETVTGSRAYGVSTSASDTDVLGLCIPPRDLVFPHLAGNINGFGRQKKNFKTFGSVNFPNTMLDESLGTEIELNVLSLIFFFSECLDCQPNRLEALFTPESCVLTSTPISDHLRKNRDLFLHQGAMWRFTGFAKSQIAKMKKKNRDPERLYKYGYHAVRMVDEGEQILKEGTLTLDSRVEKLKAIREGEWTFEEIEEYCNQKEQYIQDEFYETDKSAVPYVPDEDQVKTILLECLEEHYGSLEGCIKYGKWM